MGFLEMLAYFYPKVIKLEGKAVTFIIKSQYLLDAVPPQARYLVVPDVFAPSQ